MGAITKENWEVEIVYGKHGDDDVVSGIYVRDTPSGEFIAAIADCDDDLDDQELLSKALFHALLTAAVPQMLRMLTNEQNKELQISEKFIHLVNTIKANTTVY